MGDDGFSEHYLELVRDTPDEWRKCEQKYSTSEGRMALYNLSLIGVSSLRETEEYLGNGRAPTPAAAF